MDFRFWFYFLIIFVFGVFSVIQDIRERKVSNFITFSFMVVSFVLFLFTLKKLIWMDFILVFFGIFFSFYTYKKDFWGAADGKIFMSLLFLFVAYGGVRFFMVFVLNLLVFYSTGILSLLMLKTSIKHKFDVFKSIDYEEQLFYVFVIFSLISIVYNILPLQKLGFGFMIFTSFAFILMLRFFSKRIKFVFQKFDENSKVIVLFTMFVFLLLFFWINFLQYFVYIFFIKIFYEFVSKLLSNFLPEGGKVEYNSPFAIYMFLTAIFTLLTQLNVIKVLVLFFR